MIVWSCQPNCGRAQTGLACFLPSTQSAAHVLWFFFIDSMLLTVDYTCAVDRQILQHVDWADAFVAVLHAACTQNRAEVVRCLDSQLGAPKDGCCGYVVVACSHSSRAAGMVSMAPGCLTDVWL